SSGGGPAIGRSCSRAMKTDVSASASRGCLPACRVVRDRDVVGGIGKEVGKVSRQAGVSTPFLGSSNEGFPTHGARPNRQRDQFGHGPAADGHPEPFASLHPTEHTADVIAELPRWNVVHWQQCSILATGLHGPQP